MTLRVTALVVLLAASAFGLDITTCNTIVPDDTIGVLQTDMSCGGAFVGVRLLENATLDLNGHSITGTFPSSTLGAVECAGVRCTILSSTAAPGRIGGGDFVAVSIGRWTFNRSRLRISNVELHDARTGIEGAFYLDYPFDTRVRAEGIVSHRHSQYGIWVSRLVAKDVHADDNGAVGLAVGRLRGVDVSASRNESGVFGDRIGAVNLTANDNTTTGVRAVKIALKDSTVLGNDGFSTGVDVASLRPPRLRNTTCGKSQILAGVGSWGVCLND